MDLQKRLLTDLIPAEYNPRKPLKPEDPEYQKIKRSIEYFGYVDPIIINSDNTIIGGHQRTRVMSDMGMQEVDCVVLNLSKSDEKALNIALNKLGGEWDEETLAELLHELKDTSLEEMTGFDEVEYSVLMREFGHEFVDNTEDLFIYDTRDISDYQEVVKPKLQCPCCEHIGEVGSFKRVKEDN